MFHWPSWDGAFSLPVVQARKSGRYLRELLAQVADCRATLPGVRITLVVHSMGNRVLEAAMNLTEPVLVERSVDNLVSCAADVDLDRHASWLTRCGFAREVFVLSNASDSRLCMVEAELGRRRLGQGAPAELASNAHYIRLDDCDVDHDYFVKESPRVGEFLRVIATSGSMDRSGLREIEPRVFRFLPVGTAAASSR
jgi:esterase/lipase superfamily enzyme